jgi:MoxR-like ATPase
MRTDLPIFNGVLAPVAYEALKRGWYVEASGEDQIYLSCVPANIYCGISPMTGVPSSEILGHGPREESFIAWLYTPCIARVELTHELLVALSQFPTPAPTCAIHTYPAPSIPGEPPAVQIGLEYRIHGVGFRPLEAFAVAADMADGLRWDLTKWVASEFGGKIDPAISDDSFDTVLTLDPDAKEGALVESPGGQSAQLELLDRGNASWRSDPTGAVLPDTLTEILSWTAAEAERQGIETVNAILLAQVCAKRAPRDFEKTFGRGSVQRALELPRKRIEGSGESNLRGILASTAKVCDPTKVVIPWVLNEIRKQNPELVALFGSDTPRLIEERPHKQTNVKHGDQLIPADEIRPPLTRSELEKSLSRRVVGQDHVVERIASRVAMAQRGLTGASNRKPLGVFFFAGPTGVGKTEMAKAIADTIFEPGDNMIRLDMSEFSHDWMISRIIGPAPGYRGCDRPAGWLTTRVGSNPHTLILLDEFEKADPEIWQTFLQVFDEGRLTDSSGYVADFSKTVIVMTSNIGSQAFANNDFGFADLTDATSEAANAERAGRVISAVRHRLPPELFNRVDEAFVFNALSDEVMTQIARTRLKQVSAELVDAGYLVTFTPAVAKLVALHESDPSLGARPMNRAIDKLIREPLSELPQGSYKTAVAQGLLVFRPAA